LQGIFAKEQGTQMPRKGKAAAGLFGPGETRAPLAPNPQYTIDFERNEIHECGATLLALIAYPEDDANDTRRSNAFGSLCVFALRARYENTVEENFPQRMKPIYVFRSETIMNRDLAALRRLNAP
jgi:hypothetical protein